MKLKNGLAVLTVLFTGALAQAENMPLSVLDCRDSSFSYTSLKVKKDVVSPNEVTVTVDSQNQSHIAQMVKGAPPYGKNQIQMTFPEADCVFSKTDAELLSCQSNRARLVIDYSRSALDRSIIKVQAEQVTFDTANHDITSAKGNDEELHLHFDVVSKDARLKLNSGGVRSRLVISGGCQP